MTAPTLSICIPSHNREALALEQLQVIDAPGFLPFPFEVLVVDNASSSGYATVRDFAPRHFSLRYIRLERNIGALNNVWGSLRRAVGTFCLYLADDDRLVPETVAEIVERMQGEPDLLATFSGWQYLDLVEQKFTWGSSLGEFTFDWRNAAAPIAHLVERQQPPECGVYRTAALSRGLLPSTVIYWPFLLIERLLRFGSIRLSSRPFYNFVHRRVDEPAARSNFGRTMPLADWDSIDRALDLWVRYMPPEWVGSVPATSPYHHSRYLYRAMAFAAAVRAGRLLEAFDLALVLGASKGPVSKEELEHLFWGASMEALFRIFETVPEFDGLALGADVDDRLRGDLERVFVRLGGDTAPKVRSARELDAASRGRWAVLTWTDFERRRMLAEGSLPGLTYCLEDFGRIFRL